MQSKRLPSLTTSTEFLSWAFLVIFTGVLFWRPIATSDIWWHLKVGQYMFTEGVVPLLDPFPVSGEKTLWILTQWLGSLLYFGIYNTSGLLGLKILRVAVVLVALYQFKRFARRCGSQVLVPWIGLLLLLAVATRPHLRPFLFNVLYIQVFLSALLNFHESSRLRALWPIVLVAPLWINTHMGSFVYGFTLIGIFLVTAILDRVTQRKSSKRIGVYAGLGALYALFFVLNPYGLHGALHPLRTIFVPEYLNFGLIKSSISELQPPHLLSLKYLWFFPTLLLGGYAVYLDRENRFRNIVLLACALFLFLYGQRAAIFFAVVSLYLFLDAFGKQHAQRIEQFKSWEWLGHLLLWVLLVTVALPHVRSKVFWQGRIYRQMNMTEAHTLPDPLLQDLKWREVQGVVFNDDAYGGYMLWKVYPQLRPFVDTRQIHVQNFQLYNLILSDPTRYWSYADLTNRFQVVLLDANKAVNWKLIRFIQQRPEWSLVAVQGDQIMFLRSKKPIRKFTDALSVWDKPLLENQKRLQGILKSGPQHFNHYVYMETAATALTLFELGYRGAALERLVYSFGISNSPLQHEVTRLILDNL